MKFIKTSLACLLLLTMSVTAQVQPTEVTSEVKEKILKIEKDGTVIENSVKISTEIRQAVMTDSDDKDEVNGNRVFPPKVVVKTVEIDNDADAKIDETIKFSYITDNRTDFTLVTNRNDIMIAVEDGENLTVLENQKMFRANQQNKTSYIFTDD